MGLQLGWWTVDALDGERLARFYEQLLGWQRLFDDASGIALVPALPPTLGKGFLLYREHGTGTKQHKNRAHVDLRPRDQEAAVGRALELGATRIDIGQGRVSWEVLADPEGNEFCILTDRPELADELEVAAWALDVRHLDVAVAFWRSLLGWEVVERSEAGARLVDPSGRADPLELFVTPDRKLVKNRVHPDLFPAEGGDGARAREVERAIALGAHPVDIGQGDVPWAVLADPDGNEFCILRPPPREEDQTGGVSSG